MTAPTFTPFEDIAAAWNGVYLYRVSDEGIALPEEHKAALDTFIQYDAPPLTIQHTAEHAFANRDDLKTVAPGFVALAARCAEYAFRQCVGEMAGPRGMAITDALRRDSGEETSARYPWPEPTEDPTALPLFAAAPETVGGMIGAAIAGDQISAATADAGA